MDENFELNPEDFPDEDDDMDNFDSDVGDDDDENIE